eukprot:354622-Chlamydomonas_euryale.AAC.20
MPQPCPRALCPASTPGAGTARTALEGIPAPAWRRARAGGRPRMTMSGKAPVVAEAHCQTAPRTSA